MFKINLLAIFILAIGMSISQSQNLISPWLTYSLSVSADSYEKTSLSNCVESGADISHDKILDYIFEDKLLWINESIKTIEFINSNQTILGNRHFEPHFALWGIYRDYRTSDTFDYADLDIW